MFIEYVNDEYYHYLYISESNILYFNYVERDKSKSLVLKLINNEIYIFSDATLKIKNFKTNNEELQVIYDIYSNLSKCD